MVVIAVKRVVLRRDMAPDTVTKDCRGINDLNAITCHCVDIKIDEPLPLHCFG